MHEDELSAFKTASSTTQDVKELLISVQSATNSLKEIAQRVEDSNSRASNHAELFSEMTKLKTAIQMERRNFEMEREKMIQMVNEMAKFTREQKEVSNNERLRIGSNFLFKINFNVCPLMQQILFDFLKKRVRYKLSIFQFLLIPI